MENHRRIQVMKNGGLKRKRRVSLRLTYMYTCTFQRPLHKPNGMQDVCNQDKEHIQTMCGKCRRLGYSCIRHRVVGSKSESAVGFDSESD